MDSKQKILDYLNQDWRSFYEDYVDDLKRSGDWFKGYCPFHDDKASGQKSFIIRTDSKKGHWECRGKCNEGGDVFDFYEKYHNLAGFRETIEQMGKEYGLDVSYSQNSQGFKETYDYRNENGELVHQAIRKENKDFLQRHPGENGDWIWNMDGVDRVLYNLRQVKEAIQNSEKVYLVEGEKDAKNLTKRGLVATTNCGGAGSWENSYNKTLKDARVIVLYDADESGVEHAYNVAQNLSGWTDTVKVLQHEDLGFNEIKENHGPDVSDWLENGGTVEDLEELVQENAIDAEEFQPELNFDLDVHQTKEPIELEEAKETFHKWLYMEDDSFIDAVLGAHLTTEMAGDPVWLFLVAPPGSGKTEILRTLKDEPGAYSVDQMTNKTLVSGNKKEESSLAPKIHEKTFIIKDFGPILSLKFEQRNEIFNDLRTAYDGYIEKEFGNQAEPKRFDTHFSLLVGSTPEIDKHSSLQSQLGERFLKLRIDIDTKETREQIVQKAMQNVDSHAAMRKELKEVIEGILAGVETGYKVEFSENKLDQIGKMALFLAYCRTGVSRDRYDKTLDYLPESESGARPANQLKKMATGISWLHGKKEVTNEVLEILRKVTVGSIPVKRARIIFTLVNSEDWMKTSPIAENTNVHRKTVERSLNDLADIGLVQKEKKSYWQWKIEDRIRAYAQDAGLSYSHGNFEAGTEEEVPF